MGCRCSERARAIASGASALARGNLAGAAQSARFVTRSLAEDSHSGALQKAAADKLAQMRSRMVRR